LTESGKYRDDRGKASRRQNEDNTNMGENFISLVPTSGGGKEWFTLYLHLDKKEGGGFREERKVAILTVLNNESVRIEPIGKSNSIILD